MLPIKKVLLYKHGVGYFEREGSVEGDATIELSFKSTEMNDVLKSLTVLDLSGGLISSISYESTKPVEKQLEDIAIRLSDHNALTDLLSQVKGATVRIIVGSEEIIGKIAGIENIDKRFNDMNISTYLLNILVEGQTLKSYDIMEIKSLTFLDDNLKNDLRHLLEVLISAKKKDAKKLTIFARGEGSRELLASYVVETPVWKASYRILLDDDEEKPAIQGWALVDNTQDEDWKNVELSLVSGLPISFIHDLYSPRYKKRPIVQVQEEEAYAPPVLEEGMPMEPAFGDAECEEMICGFDRMQAPMQMLGAAPPSAPKRSRSPQEIKEARKASTAIQTRTVEVGDLFQYAIKNPVTVKRNQSALVPILHTDFRGKRVAIYNKDIRDKNPMTALLMKNNTGMTLEGGPMTVMENETYVGEAMLDTLKPDEERIIPFSVELGCLIITDQVHNRQKVFQVRIIGGYVYLDYHQLYEKTYTVKNKNEKPLDLFLEHRINHGWDLVDTPKPYETTENFYRFRFGVPPGQTVTFKVKEKQQIYENYSLWNIYDSQIDSWSRSGYIDNKTRNQMEEIMRISGEVSDLDNRINGLDQEQSEIIKNQNRLRENLKALGDSTDEKKLKERYVNQLNTEEDRLEEITKELKKLRSDREALQVKRKNLIDGMKLTKTV